MAKRKLQKRKYAQGVKKNSDAVVRYMEKYGMGPRAVRQEWNNRYGEITGIRWNELHDGRKMKFIDWLRARPVEEAGEE